jgi:acyl-CoA thioester hydrolase
VPRHVAEVPVRWSDVDQLGHVNNIAFLRFLQEARVEMLFDEAGQRAGSELARGVVVHRHEISYRAALDLRPEPIRVETWVRGINAASFELGYEVVDGAADGDERTVYAVATSTLVPFDLAGGHPRRVSRADRAILGEFLDDGPAPGVEVSWADHGAAHVSACAVRFDDLDSYGHVNNVVLADYAQQGAFHFYGTHVEPEASPTEKAVRAGLTLDYLQPIPLRSEPLEIVTRVSRVGRSSFDLTFDVRDAETLFARVGCAMVAIDTESGRSRPLNDGERRVLDEFAGTSAAVASA